MILVRKVRYLWQIFVLLSMLLFNACGDGSSTDLPTNTNGFLAINYQLVAITNTVSVTADGSATATITVQVQDSDRGLLVGEGTRITFSTTLGSIPTVALTDSDSLVEVDIFSSTAGSATITATAPDGSTDTVTITFTP